jgi:hypothetical protein
MQSRRFGILYVRHKSSRQPPTQESTRVARPVPSNLTQESTRVDRPVPSNLTQEITRVDHPANHTQVYSGCEDDLRTQVSTQVKGSSNMRKGKK